VSQIELRTTTKRVDAARNIARILDAATAVFSEDPAAGMGEVAERAEVGRATLYRHFPSRDELVEAIRARARREAVEAVEACPVDEGTAVECIEHIVRVVIEQGDRYRFLHRDPKSLNSVDKETRDRCAAVMRAAIERGQRRGELSRAVPAESGALAMRALMLAAIEELSNGRLSQAEAEQLVSRIVLHGLSPVPRERAA
jgi:TetR/AcrR family transcriptional regulator, mexCD-oprJ operon repressor